MRPDCAFKAIVADGVFASDRGRSGLTGGGHVGRAWQLSRLVWGAHDGLHLASLLHILERADDEDGRFSSPPQRLG